MKPELINCKDTWNIPQQDGSFKRVKMNQLSYTQCKAASIILLNSKKEIINGKSRHYLLQIVNLRLKDIQTENRIIDKMINDMIVVCDNNYKQLSKKYDSNTKKA